MTHKIAHWLGWNKGMPDAFYQGNKLMMSFLCSGCGKRQGVHEITDLINSLTPLKK